MVQLILLAGLSLLMATLGYAGSKAEYVGRDACKTCHQQQFQLWSGSHHDLAMQHADDETVLADFSDASFSYAGITSKFYRKNNKFMVRTDGPDGKLHDYQVKYTFGVTPLQQYLVELEAGRLQALTIAWDSRDKAVGGQRWFHLYPGEELTARDELHWTRASFNWNGMCAECHSTNLQKNYDDIKHRFNTTWSEIDVSCEACHGPASAHLQWAAKQQGAKAQPHPSTTGDDKGLVLQFDERKGIHWSPDKTTGSALRSQARQSEKEIEVCARCHSRRSLITEDYQPGERFADHHMPRLLDEGMYHPDGQIQQEVYVYGSFLQSKMYHRGVTCSDCHEPHSLQLRQQANGVCLQCHAAEKFDNKKHHFHDLDTAGASCAECHMPATDYMVVDPRHDHSIRIPRPDLSLELGVPNACNRCHDDKDATWSADKVKQWYGELSSGYQQFAPALAAARLGQVKASRMLSGLIVDNNAPDIARATAASHVSAYLDQSTLAAVQRGLADGSAMVRMASVSALEGLPQAILVQLAFPLLDDEARSVRIEAARVLLPLSAGQLQGEQLSIYKRAMKEYVKSQLVNADLPEAQVNLGNYYTAKEDAEKAVAAYEKAIMLDDAFVPAYINLADFYRARKNDAEAEKLLKTAENLVPENADVQHSLGLLKIRQHKNDEAIEYLHRAASFDTGNAHYAYVYAVALNSMGRKDEAIDVLQDADFRFPGNVAILEALITFHRDAGNDFALQTYINKLEKLRR